MATFKIKEIYRDTVNTKYGEKESIRLVPEESSIADVNGDLIELNGRKVSGFKDKAGETDKWKIGTVVKVKVITKKSIGKEGDEMEWVNFAMPEGVSSIVSQPDTDAVEVTDPTDDF